MKYAEVCYTCVKFARDTQEQITPLPLVLRSNQEYR